jgi:hypothetical protein
VAGGPCDVRQVVNLYSGIIIRHGRLVPRSMIVIPILPQLFQHLVQTGEMVVDRRSVLFATYRLQRKESGQRRNQRLLKAPTVVLMQSYSALADSAHAPVVVTSFFAAQHPSMVVSSGAQRLSAAPKKWSEQSSTNRPSTLFFGRTLSFWMCMLFAWGRW